MKPLKVKLTPQQDHDLHAAAFNARKGSKVVKVDLEALQNLLIDHGKALAELPEGYEHDPNA